MLILIPTFFHSPNLAAACSQIYLSSLLMSPDFSYTGIKSIGETIVPSGFILLTKASAPVSLLVLQRSVAEDTS